MATLGRIALSLGAMAIAALAARNRAAQLDQRANGWLLDELRRQHRAPRKKPPEAGLPLPAISPEGPKPKLGGATAPLEFDS